MKRLAGLRVRHSAAIERNVEPQADAALLHVAVVARIIREEFVHPRIGKAQAVVVALAVAGHRIQRRCVTGPPLAQGFAGGIDGLIHRQQGQVLLRRRVDPGGGVVGHRWEYREAVFDALQGDMAAVGQGEQRLKRILHLALGDHPVRPRGIESGLRFEGIGAVGEADLETLVGLVELSLEGCLFGLDRCQVVLGLQHREISLGALQDQILLGDRVFQRRLLADRLRRLQLEPAIGTEQRLAQGGLVDDAATRQRACAGTGIDVRAGVVQLGTGVQVG